MSPLARIQPFAAVIYLAAGAAFGWDYLRRHDWISGLLSATLLLTGVGRLWLWRSIRARYVAQQAADGLPQTASARRARPWHRQEDAAE